MNQERHRQAADLFDRLQDLPAAERERTLEAACGSDDALKQFVRNLLAADAEAPGGFLSGHAVETAARWVEASDALSGVRLGQYRLTRVIGAGGMGTVYEAVDERLNRPVAVKVLPAEAVRDGDRLRRFEQEARAASLLNHPNIVSVYDAAEEDGRHYLATELVIGKTLREMIEAGPTDSKTVLEIGAQVASALEAAHQADIVHRDIKPENVMVRPDGFVKVLDFGLAKLRDLGSGEKLDLTRPGQVAGTLRYLSPEQVLGQPVGPRSDIFSLGVLLYELATGVRPFDGPTDGAIFNAISNRAPVAPGTYRPDLWPSLESVILRALEKDPDLRFQTASDVRAACRHASRGSAEIPAPALPPKKRGWLRPALAGSALAAALVLTAAWFLWPPAAPVTPLRFERLTTGPDEDTWPSLAGDAKQFVYAGVQSGKWSIFLQRIGGRTSLNLTGDSGADDLQPALSPDGSQIVFQSSRDGGGLFLIGATGENPRRLTRGGFHPAWSADGKRIAYSTHGFVVPGERSRPVSRLRILDVDTRREREIPFEDAIQPAWSPHGKRLAYWGLPGGGRRDIFTVGTGPSPAPPVAVTADAALDWNPVWSPEGDALYFLSDRGGTMNVWRVAIDEDTGQTLGSPQPVTLPADTVSFLSLAAGGAGMVYGQLRQRIDIIAAEFDPGAQAVTGVRHIETGQSVTNISFSPNGQQMVTDSIGDPQEDLWIMNKDGSGRRRLTSDAFKDRTPYWSPRGDEILFFSDRAGKYDLWIIRPDGSDLRQVTDARYPMQKSIWNRDGSRILATWNGPGNFWIDPKTPTPVSDGTMLKGLEKGPSLYVNAWPPTGDLIAGERSGELILYSLATEQVEHTGIAVRRICWIGSGHLVFGRESKVILLDLGTRRERELLSLAPNRWYSCAVPPGGRQIYFTEVIRESDFWYAAFPPPRKRFGLF